MNQIQTTAVPKLFIGMDVHKKSWTVHGVIKWQPTFGLGVVGRFATRLPGTKALLKKAKVEDNNKKLN